MKKEITVGQLLSVGATLLVAIVTGWVTLNNKVSSHSAEIKALQDAQTKWERIVERVEAKIDKGNEIQTQILIKLENKIDRQ